jgi:outer membrane protein assembly factor BamE (lipoprotein component of BamABCDE complex)
MRIAILGLSLLAIVACKSPDSAPVDRGNLTLGAVQVKIVNGTTTKAQVMEWFGSPNIVTRDKDGEVWNYTRQGTASELRQSGVGVWFLIGSGGSATGFAKSGSYSFDLLIRFDQGDRVVDHKVMQTAF